MDADSGVKIFRNKLRTEKKIAEQLLQNSENLSEERGLGKIAIWEYRWAGPIRVGNRMKSRGDWENESLRGMGLQVFLNLRKAMLQFLLLLLLRCSYYRLQDNKGYRFLANFFLEFAAKFCDISTSVL